jgi:ubiquinone/menaquinone biosynthesis C-methylase UbiE/pimeloyl-ACP methyl ester carboxylesterase
VRLASAKSSQRVAIDTESGDHVIGRIEDQSADGLGVMVPAGSITRNESYRGFKILGQVASQPRRYAKVANWSPESPNGWQRIGLSVTSALPGEPVALEKSNSLKGAGSIRSNLRFVRAGLLAAAQRLTDRVWHVDRPLPKIRVVEFRNFLGERIRAIIDSYGDTRGAPAVVIPPAWGKTKETLLPLAASIVSTFRAVDEPVVVLRFDGIRKRGESHLDPECLEPGAENTRFTFSQGAEDIHTALDFLESSPEFKPYKSILVSFSGASIDSRRAVAMDRSRRLCAWISVVGAGDLQSMMRVISGGVDYLGGVSRGIGFGVQDILGLLVDVDTSSRDALDHHMAFLEDSRCDFSSISVPVTWIHGQYDAWMDASRARHVLSFGNQGNRRFIEIPTGHQLRASSDAMSAFGLIAQEAARFLLGKPVEPTPPSLVDLQRRIQAERNRLPKRNVEVRKFWERYLLGGDSHIGMELLTSTRHYRNFTRTIVEELQLQPGSRVLDLGAGTGTLAQALIREHNVAGPRVEILQVDYVRRALQRAREQCAGQSSRHSPSLVELVSDLEMSVESAYLPLADGSVDRIAATLLLNYLRNPDRLLHEAHRVLRPGGRMVVTTLRPDADISRICVDGAAELRQGLAQREFGEEGVRVLDESIRHVISDAARILDFEELGLFRFWDKAELLRMIRKNGFRVISISSIFGSPPQAIKITAQPS